MASCQNRVYPRSAPCASTNEAGNTRCEDISSGRGTDVPASEHNDSNGSPLSRLFPSLSRLFFNISVALSDRLGVCESSAKYSLKVLMHR